MITPEIKDRILSDFVKTGTTPEFALNKYAADVGVRPDVLEIILDQFNSMGLLRLNKFVGGTVLAHLTADAFDLHRLGGFTAREEVFKLELEKLKREIESLRDTAPAETERISNIIANIFSVVPILFK